MKNSGMYRPLYESDPQIAAAIDNETRRQHEGLELIASENFVSEAVLEPDGSISIIPTKGGKIHRSRRAIRQQLFERPRQAADALTTGNAADRDRHAGGGRRAGSLRGAHSRSADAGYRTTGRGVNPFSA